MPTILKKLYATEADVPETAKTLYKQDGDKWILNDVSIEGTIPASKLEEFRTNNTKLTDRLKAYGDAEFGGGELNPERLTELLGIEKDVHDGKLSKSDEIRRRIEEGTKEVTDTYRKKESKWNEQRAVLNARLTKALIDSAALAAAARHGLKKGAEVTFLPFMRSTFTIDDNGEPVAFEADGKTVRIDANGDPMRGRDAVEKFVAQAATGEHKYFFVDNAGQGAGGQGAGGGGAGVITEGEINPWDEKTWNRTAQTQLVKKDFPKAQRMAKKFGFELRPSTLRTVPAG